MLISAAAIAQTTGTITGTVNPVLHSIERFRRPDRDHLELELTLDDPGAYTKPWTVKKVTTLAPAGEELMEYVCEENNCDVEHLVGK